MRPGFAALAFALAFASSCRAQINDGLDPSASASDAATATDGNTSTPPGTDATIPPDPPCTKRSVYLNFDGQDLTQGPSNARTNTAEWMTIAAGRAPPYRANDPARDTTIKAITDGIRRQLSQFPITVVTDRPRTGSYMMIVYGGVPADVGSRFSGTVNQLDCDGSRDNDVAWVSDAASPTQRVINSSIGAIGFGLGLTATRAIRDCMCGWDNTCRPDNSAACDLGSPIARDPAARQVCPGAAASQDEVATIRAAFCD